MTSVADYYLAKIRADIGQPPKQKPRRPENQPSKPIAATIEGETLQPIDGYPGYWISDHGRVLSKLQNAQGKTLTPSIIRRHGYDYERVGFLDKKCFYVHSLVAKTFCFRGDPGDVIWHIDRDTRNNHYLNLEWISRAELRQRRKRD